MRRLMHSFIFLGLCVGSAWCSDLEQLRQQHQHRLEQSLRKLQAEREDRSRSVTPLQKDIEYLKSEYDQWNDKLLELRSIQDSKSLSLDELKTEEAALQKELDHLENVQVREFIAEERAALFPWHPRFHALRELDLNIESGNLQTHQSLDAQLSAVQDMVVDLKAHLGAQRIPASVLDAGGHRRDGTVVDIGPEQFFMGTDKMHAGRLVSVDHGQIQLDERDAQAISSWFEGQSPTLPLDVTGGSVSLAQAQQTSTWEHVQKGGLWVYPIMAFALLSALLGLIKAIALYGTRISKPLVGHQMAKHLCANQVSEAMALAQAQPRSCQSMWIAAIEHGRGQPELTEEVMAEAMMERQPSFERFLSFIAVTAAVAPLLGLLGTVTGIIKTFDMMAIFGAGDPKPLIGGISEALITTELGLILAIPALLLHALLSRRAQSLMAKMERASVAMVNGLLSCPGDFK